MSDEVKKEGSEKDDRTLWEKMLEQNIPESYTKYFKDEEEFLLKYITEKDASVLDVGCGEGRSMIPLLERTKNCVGLDRDDKIIEKASSSKYGSQIKFVKGDADNIPLEDKSFDFVICMLTFVNFGEVRHKVISEMTRVMKDDGVMLITSYSDDALEDRKTLYEKVNVKIDKIVGTTFHFEGNCEISEQFSVEEVKKIFEEQKDHLEIIQVEKDGLGVFARLKKKL